MKLRRAATAASAAALLTLTACGSSEPLDQDADPSSQPDSDSASEPDDTDSADEPDDTDTDSGDEPSDEPSDADVATSGLTAETFAQEVTAAQTEAGSATMDMTITSGGQVITAQGQVLTGESVEESGADMTMTVPGLGDLEMILIDGDLYLNLGDLSQNKFVVIDLDDSSNPLAKSFEGFEDQFDVAATTKALEDAIVDFEAVGPESVEGVEAERYDVTVNTEDMLETLGAVGGGPAAGGLPKTLTYSFWTDADDLPVKMTTEAAGLLDMQIVFSDWGAPVEIAPPPAGRISKKDPFSTAG